MARIWNWTITAYNKSGADFHTVTLKSDPFPRGGVNVFAQCGLSMFATHPIETNIGVNSPGVRAYIQHFAKWEPDGTEGAPTETKDFPSALFIENCAWVEVALSVCAANAQADLTLIEWN